MSNTVIINPQNFPSLRNIGPGEQIDVVLQATVLDYSDSQITLDITTLDAKQGFIGRFDRLAKIMDKFVSKDGRLKVETQQQHLGNT